MQRSVKFSAKLNNLIAGISDRITRHTNTCRQRERRKGERGGEKEAKGLLSATPREAGEVKAGGSVAYADT